MVVRSALDRCLAVAYGPVHDLVVERFKPYRALEHEVLDLVELAVPRGVGRRSVRILDIGCGPGTFTAMLGAAGFSALGIDRYTPLLDVARETRRSRGLTNVSFSRLDLDAFADGEFDQVVSIHALYVHPEPERTLAHAARVLKPGGHAVFVNHVSRYALRRTFFTAARRRGWLYALGTLRWLVPNRLFETVRRPVGPHYWDEAQLATRFVEAGFTVLDVRRTFLDGGSVLVWARKDAR
jgi:phosphatidylethanolamine/phosphatidyl-N-methylethanolamine N-methyltransferase